jgi:uncharacterized protein (DUF1015 family)
LSLIQPFRALRPAPDHAAEVLAPPYDVLSAAEARELAKGHPWSFLHVSKPEIDLAPEADPYGAVVYATGGKNFARMIEAGVLVRDEAPGYYVYRLTRGRHVQTGLAAVASLADYATNRVRKHELTTPRKEDDRVNQIEAVNAQTGPVMMAYPHAPHIDAILARESARAPDSDVTWADGTRHELWSISDAATIESLTREFEALPAIYIADGHHRSAAAARVSASRGNGSGSHRYFLSVIFPDHEMAILAYNRVIADLNGRTPAELVAALGKAFAVERADGPVEPHAPNIFGMFLDGKWYRLTIKPGLVPTSDPIGRLPITVLTRNVIEPLFGISDPRTDKRIDFVGGGRGTVELERLVSSGQFALAFSLYPTQMADVMAVADRGGVMPPKSTWFEPKLADGMVSHVLD